MRKPGILLAFALLGGTALAQESDPLPNWANLPSRQAARVRVVETDMVPRTIATRHGLRVISGRREPIGKRIIEVPDSRKKAGAQDPRLGLVAYVPRGSVARGKRLVESGAGAFLPCAACHGPAYKRAGAVPALAGRSPSGIVRQLYEYKHGSRGGPAADMMKQEVSNLTADMRLDIAAYLASLTP